MYNISDIIEEALENFGYDRPLTDFIKEAEWEEFIRKHPADHWEKMALGEDDDAILNFPDFPSDEVELGKIDESDIPF